MSFSNSDASDMSGPESAELWLKAMISQASEDGSPETFDTTALSSLQAGDMHGMHWAISSKGFISTTSRHQSKLSQCTDANILAYRTSRLGLEASSAQCLFCKKSRTDTGLCMAAALVNFCLPQSAKMAVSCKRCCHTNPVPGMQQPSSTQSAALHWSQRWRMLALASTSA